MPRKRPPKAPTYEPPIYTFRVRMFPSPYAPPDPQNIWREIEIAANQPLDFLGHIIPYAFDFDDDHLWAFYLSGKAFDERTEYTIDPNTGAFGGHGIIGAINSLSRDDVQALFASMGPTGEFESLDPAVAARLNQALRALDAPRGSTKHTPTGPYDAREFAIKDVPFPGKTGKVEFLYIFDYGDEWRFGVKLLRTSPTVESGVEYPRVVASAGEAPPQYPYAEDFDGDEDEWIEDEGEGEEADSASAETLEQQPE